MLTGSDLGLPAHFSISNAGPPLPTYPAHFGANGGERAPNRPRSRGVERGDLHPLHPGCPHTKWPFLQQIPGREKEGVNVQPSAPPPLSPRRPANRREPQVLAQPSPGLTCPWLRPPPARTSQICPQCRHRVSAFPLSGSKPFDPEACP